MEELLKQILEKMDKSQSQIDELVKGQSRIDELVKGQSKMELQIDELVKGQSRMEKLQKIMAKDMKVIKDYQHKGLDIDIKKLQVRVEIIETILKIS